MRSSGSFQTQFWEAERQDVTVNFVEPRSSAAMTARAPARGHRGGAAATVAVRVRAGYRERYLAITGVPPTPRLKRIVDRNGGPIRSCRAESCSRRRWRSRSESTGDVVTIEVLEGHRPAPRVEVAGLVDDLLGLSAYMDIEALHRLMREGDVATGALMLVDSAEEASCRHAQGDPDGGRHRLQALGARDFREVLAANSWPVDLHQPGVRERDRVRRRLQRGADLALGAQPRAGQPARARLYAGGDLAHPDGRAGAADAWYRCQSGVHSGTVFLRSSWDRSTARSTGFPLYVSRQAVAWSFLGIIGAALVSGLIVDELDALDLVACAEDT